MAINIFKYQMGSTNNKWKIMKYSEFRIHTMILILNMDTNHLQIRAIPQVTSFE